MINMIVSAVLIKIKWKQTSLQSSPLSTNPPAPSAASTSFLKDSWKRAKVSGWRRALAITPFHWLISPYSSRTQARQTRTISASDQRRSLSGGSNSLCTCGTVTQRCTHTHTHGGTCGTFPVSHTDTCASYLWENLLFLSSHTHIHTHFHTSQRILTQTHFV